MPSLGLQIEQSREPQRTIRVNCDDNRSTERLTREFYILWCVSGLPQCADFVTVLPSEASKRLAQNAYVKRDEVAAAMLRKLHQDPEGSAKAMADFLIYALRTEVKRRETKYVIVDSSDSVHSYFSSSDLLFRICDGQVDRNIDLRKELDESRTSAGVVSSTYARALHAV